MNKTHEELTMKAVRIANELDDCDVKEVSIVFGTVFLGLRENNPKVKVLDWIQAVLEKTKTLEVR